MRHSAPNGLQLALRQSIVSASQIQMLDLVVGCVEKNLLGTIGTDDGAQHVMAVDQSLPCCLDLIAVRVRHMELEIDVTPDVAELEIIAAAEPISPLHLGERKRLVAKRQAREQR